MVTPRESNCGGEGQESLETVTSDQIEFAKMLASECVGYQISLGKIYPDCQHRVEKYCGNTSVVIDFNLNGDMFDFEWERIQGAHPSLQIKQGIGKLLVIIPLKVIEYCMQRAGT